MVRESLVILILLFTLSACGGRTGPEGKARVFAFGDVVEQYGGLNSYAVIELDPAIDVTFVPTRPGYLGGQENAKRNLRIYMPRTYEGLVGDYDLILSSDADSTVFRLDWMDWMARSVREEGLGLEWLGSIGRSPNQQHLDWSWTPIADLLPSYTSPRFYEYGVFRVRTKDPQEALMAALPWEDSPPLANVDMQVPKIGSKVWAAVDGPAEWPLMTYWETGSGAALTFASKFPNGVMPWSRDWPLFTQAMIYITYRVSGKELPRDHLLFQGLLSSFFEYESGEGILLSLINFVESFGGGVQPLYEELDQISAAKSNADRAYMDGEFTGSMEALEGAIAAQGRLLARSLEAKDRALLWIYAFEWLVSSAALLISGFVLWSLMVKRRLYAEVGSSRLAPGPRAFAESGEPREES